MNVRIAGYTAADLPGKSGYSLVRWYRPGALKSPDLALLVDTEHQRTVRRRQMESATCGSLESLNISGRYGGRAKIPLIRGGA